MENYFIGDYIKSVSGEKEKGKRKREILRKKALELWDKDISASEIALILELSEEQLKEVLGIQRIERGHKSRVMPSERKLTPRRVNSLANSRDKQIIELSKTMNMARVAQTLNISLELIKELYLALGLPIYTQEELRKMEEAKKERDIKDKEEKPKENKAKTEKNEEKGNDLGKVENDVKQPEVQEEVVEVDINDFEDVKRKIHEYIGRKDIKTAIGIAKRAMEQGDLIDKEKRKLKELVDLVESIERRQIYRRSTTDDGHADR